MAVTVKGLPPIVAVPVIRRVGCGAQVGVRTRRRQLSRSCPVSWLLNSCWAGSHRWRAKGKLRMPSV